MQELSRYLKEPYLTSISMDDVQTAQCVNLAALPNLGYISMTGLKVIYSGASTSNGLNLAQTSLTGMNFPSLRQVAGGNISLPANPAINFNAFFPRLEKCDGINISMGCSYADFPSLTTISNIIGSSFSVSSAQITGMNFPLLKKSGSIFSCSQVSPNSDFNISFPSLQSINSLSITAGIGMGKVGTMSFPELLHIDVSINFIGITGCTGMSFPKLKYIGTMLFIQNFNTLGYISFPELTKINSGIVIQNSTGCTGLNFPSLSTQGFSDSDFNINNMTGLISTNSFNFPSLSVIFQSFVPSTNVNLSYISLPSLTGIGGAFTPSTMTGCTGMNFPVLNSITGLFNPTTMASCTTISMPSIRYISPTTTTNVSVLTTTSMDNLTNFLLPTNMVRVGGTGPSVGNVVFAANTLTQASVDSILIALDNISGFTTRTVNLGTGSATPSASGLAAKSSLIAKGCTVTTN